jgi:hypothetical protein
MTMAESMTRLRANSWFNLKYVVGKWLVLAIFCLGICYVVRWWALDSVGAIVIVRGGFDTCILADTDDAHTVATYASVDGRCGGNVLRDWRVKHWW